MRQYQIQDYETDGATCPICGNKYSGRSGLSKHHAAQHGEKFKPLAACDWCGDLYTETVGNLYAADRHYCSEQCRSKGYTASRTGSQVERSEKVCDECGVSFEALPCEDHRRFCSMECSQEWHKGRPRMGTRNREMSECEYCEQSFEHVVSETPRFCSRDCCASWKSERTGRDHPLWEGGTDWYRSIRSALGPTGWRTQRKRHLADCCQICGTSEGRLALHHIIPVLSGGLNEDWNYMTLCTGCHTTTERHTETFTDRPLAPE